MKKVTRINAIRATLIQEGSVSVSDLATRFNTSRRTVRRDLEYLNSINVADLFYGGAKLKVFNHAEKFKNIGIKKIMNEFSFPAATENNQSQTFDIGVYVLGSFNIDVVSITEHLPRPGQTVHASSTRFLPGGKGSNQATAISKVINNTHLTVKLGKDSFSEIAKNYLSASSINTLTVLESENESTGNALIMVDGTTGENSIAIDLGANKTISDDELIMEFPLIESSKVFLTQLENNFELTKKALSFAHGSTPIVILNPAPYTPRLKEVIHFVDVITPNETEAEDLTGIKIECLDTALRAAKSIHSMGANIVILTLGGAGVLLYDGMNALHCPAFRAAVEDTSGAGDSFNGALAAMLSKGKTIKESVLYASAFASLAVERSGAANMPEHNLVLDRLNLQGDISLLPYTPKNIKVMS